MRRPPRPRCHRGAPRAGAGARQHAAGPLQRGLGQQALWQEFRDHSTLLNNALNEALWVHAGPAWQIFRVRVLIVEFEVFPCRFCTRAFPDFAFSCTLFSIDRSWRVGPKRGTTASIS
jgi:hypothetical protein